MQRSSTYDLRWIQHLVREERYRITVAAAKGAAELGLDEADIRDCISMLQPLDFYKTMPSEKAPALWQDVYRPRYVGKDLYVKLQVARSGVAVVIQFKRR